MLDPHFLSYNSEASAYLCHYLWLIKLKARKGETLAAAFSDITLAKENSVFLYFILNEVLQY